MPIEPTRNGTPVEKYDTDSPAVANNAPISIHFCSPNLLTKNPDITPANIPQT